MKNLSLPEEVQAELDLMAGRIWGMSQALETSPLDMLDIIGRKIVNHRADPNQLTFVAITKVEGRGVDHFHFEHQADRDPDPLDEDRHTCGAHHLPQESNVGGCGC